MKTFFCLTCQKGFTEIIEHFKDGEPHNVYLESGE